jgi:VanZ family protein
MVAIFHVSAQPQPRLGRLAPDYLWHWAGYFGLGLLAVRAWGGGLPPARPSAYVLGVALTSAYGVSDEWHQSFVPGRVADWRDAAMDALGAASAAGSIRFCQRKLRGRY